MATSIDELLDSDASEDVSPEEWFEFLQDNPEAKDALETALENEGEIQRRRVDSEARDLIRDFTDNARFRVMMKIEEEDIDPMSLVIPSSSKKGRDGLSASYIKDFLGLRDCPDDRIFTSLKHLSRLAAQLDMTLHELGRPLTIDEEEDLSQMGQLPESTEIADRPAASVNENGTMVQGSA